MSAVRVTRLFPRPRAAGRPLSVHSWAYGLEDGLLRDLGFTVAGQDEVAPTYTRTIAAVGG